MKLSSISLELYELSETLLSLIPGQSGIFCRRLFYRCFLKKCGEKIVVEIRCRLQSPSNIIIGNNSGINIGTILAANKNEKGSITIGNNVIIGPYCILHSGNHNYQNRNVPIRDQGHTFQPIVIEDDVWLGSRVTILAGVKIGKGSVIGAGAVVTKDTDPYGIYAGIPAEKIKDR